MVKTQLFLLLKGIVIIHTTLLSLPSLFILSLISQLFQNLITHVVVEDLGYISTRSGFQTNKVSVYYKDPFFFIFCYDLVINLDGHN